MIKKGNLYQDFFQRRYNAPFPSQGNELMTMIRKILNEKTD
jgi:hypothetical protein